MNKKYLMLFVTIIALFAYASFAAAAPTGAACSAGSPQSWNGSAICNVTTQGGNITEVNLTVDSQTLAWQGFFGEVSGNITLRDNSGDQMYSWPGAAVTGEVYASSSNSIDWTTVTGVTLCTVDETLTGTGSDRVNNTFTRNNSVSGWSIGTVAVTDACQTYTYVNNASQTTSFEEIILSATGATSIYATKINADTTGFDGLTHDYQLIVPETTTSSTTTYYFYAELS